MWPSTDGVTKEPRGLGRVVPCFARAVGRAFPGSPMLLLGGALFPGALHAQDPALSADPWNRAALEWIHLLEGGDFEAAGALVDPAVPPGALGPPELETLWGQLGAQLGSMESVAPGPVTVAQQYHLVDLPARFAAQEVVLRVVLTDSLQVSGFFIRPPAPPAYDPPSYVDPEAFQEEEVSLGSDPWVLPGTLTLPAGDGPFPGVVLVHGSGPNDRDETVGGNRPFRDLAWGLASRGIAVLRYDKRTRVYGGRFPSDAGLEEEVVQDALAAMDLLRSRTEVDPGRVFLLGHSLGGMLAPRIAGRDDRVAGVIVLAAPVRPALDVLEGQLRYIAGLRDPDSPEGASLDSLLAQVEAVRRGEAPPDEPILGAPAPYWRELEELDPIADARTLTVPLLVLQGGRDYQSTPADLEMWQEALEGQAGFRTILYPALNHLFAPGEGMATPEEYAGETRHVDGEVIGDVAGWILEPGRRGTRGPGR